MYECPRCGKKCKKEGLCRSCSAHFRALKQIETKDYWNLNKRQGYNLYGRPRKIKVKITLAPIKGPK